MNDVLSGRGAWFNQHPGNKRFRRMLEEKKVRELRYFPLVQLNFVDGYHPEIHNRPYVVVSHGVVVSWLPFSYLC